MTISFKAKKILMNLFILCFCCILNNCNSSYNNYLDQNRNNQYTALKEYISRVGKRLLITNHEKHIIKNLEISFEIRHIKDLLLKIETPGIFNNVFNNSNKKQYTIVISTSLLNHLHDEAGLATVLAMGIEIIHSNDFFNSKLSQALKADNRIINNLYHSGYDPEAFINFQREYLILKRQHFKNNWLNFLFANTRVSTTRIAVNKRNLLSIPKGLEKGKQSYLQNTELFRTFNW